jgi:hypothetical protein
MDPQVCLIEMLAYLREGEWLDAQQCLSDLIVWHKKQGFSPDLARALDAVIQGENESKLVP